MNQNIKNKTGYNLIRNTENNIRNINDQIATLKLVEKNAKKEFSKDDVGLACVQIQDLTHQESGLRTLLVQQKCTALKEDLQEEVKLITDCLVSENRELASNDNEFHYKEKELVDLNNILENLKWIEKNEKVDVTDQINEQNALISECKREIDLLKGKSNQLQASIKKIIFKNNVIQSQAFHIEAIASLKTQLIDCELRLKALSSGKADLQKQADQIKLEMKSIVKEMIHSKTFLCLLSELKKNEDYLANLDYLQTNGERIEASEFEIINNSIKFVESQIELEFNKTPLQKELKENQLTLLNLNAVKESKDLEDVSNVIKSTSLKIVQLTQEITKITMQSIGATKSLNERVATKLSETLDARPDLSMAEAVPSAKNIFIEEIQKWLSENILEEAFGGNLQESLVSTALLTFTKSKVKPGNVQERENEELTKKIKGIAIGACEKFCMIQVVGNVLSSNPLISTLYGFGLLAQHFVFDDGDVHTLGNKMKKFAVSESIKTAGNLLLGTAVAGTLGSGLALSSTTYLAYYVIAEWYQRTDSVEKDPSQDLYDASMDMIADSIVDKIYNDCSKIIIK